jgi:hypothetical protein
MYSLQGGFTIREKFECMFGEVSVKVIIGFVRVFNG